LVEAHNLFYRNPRRLLVVGAGLVRHDELVELAKRAFGALLERRADDGKKIETVRKNGRLRHREERLSNEASFLLLGFNISPILQVENDEAAFALLMSILDDSMSSRLYQALREENGIGYDIKAWHELSKTFAVAFFEVACENRMTLNRAEEVIRTEIGLVRKTPVTRKELRGHRRKLRTEVRDAIDIPDELRDELFRQLLREKPKRLYAQYHALPSVSAADILRVAQKYLDPDACAVVRIEGGE